MKALTLTQPYATLIALGAKHIETRGWQTSYRGRIAIHAGKGPGQLGWPQMQHLCRNVEPFKSVLAPLLQDRHPADVLPLGAVIATARIVTILHTEECTAISDNERAFGDYRMGRYAWILRDVEVLPKPIPARGALSLWEWAERAEP